MRKILFHISSFEQGGAERVISNLANHLSQEECQVVVVTQRKGNNEYFLDERIKRIHIAEWKHGRELTGPIGAFYRIWNLRRVLKQETPDVAIGFLKKNNYRLLIAGIGKKIPTIIAVRNDPNADHVDKMDKLLIPLLYKRAKGAVFQTEQQKAFFPKAIQKKAVVIFNPVNKKYLNVEPPKQKEKIIIHSGRIVAAKNHVLLVRAFLKVHEKHPEYKLFMYGRDTRDGTKKKVEELIEQNQATSYIKFMGACNELEKAIPKGEIYVLSSFYEGMPNALIEAMILGMPVVSTDCPCGGPGTLIRNGYNGLLVPVNDVDAMADSICYLIEKPEFANELGENAKKISEYVNEEAIVMQWKNYIEKVITTKNN